MSLEKTAEGIVAQASEGYAALRGGHFGDEFLLLAGGIFTVSVSTAYITGVMLTYRLYGLTIDLVDYLM
jgi:hypothetical protein